MQSYNYKLDLLSIFVVIILISYVASNYSLYPTLFVLVFNNVCNLSNNMKFI